MFRRTKQRRPCIKTYRAVIMRTYARKGSGVPKDGVRAQNLVASDEIRDFSITRIPRLTSSGVTKNRERCSMGLFSGHSAARVKPPCIIRDIGERGAPAVPQNSWVYFFRVAHSSCPFTGKIRRLRGQLFNPLLASLLCGHSIEAY